MGRVLVVTRQHAVAVHASKKRSRCQNKFGLPRRQIISLSLATPPLLRTIVVLPPQNHLIQLSFVMTRPSRRFLLGGSVAAVLCFLLLSLPSITFAGQDPPKLCMMMYMVADNNLEPAMFGDLGEYFSSDAMYQPNVNTWIYWDR